MRLKIRSVLMAIIGMFVLYGTGFSADIDVGQVIEMSPDRKFIQVNDQVYQVGEVKKIMVKGKSEDGDINDLTEGGIVQVVRGEKEVDYWHADLITVYLGEMEKMKREEMELPPLQEGKNKKSQQKVKKTIHSSPMVLENGIWHN